jgi:acyl-CoA dehydrogenase family protein 9
MREFPYEQILRDCRINRIFEGTNEILRLFIALTGMNDVGSQLQELASTLKGVFSDPIKGFGVLSEYALRRASWATGFIGRPKDAFTKILPPLKAQAELFQESTRELATAVDRVLRKHGKHIIGKQFASKRLADMMVDLFVFACVLSRVNTSIQRAGLEASAKEVEILKTFAGQARTRLKENASKIDDNDDELIKALADDALEREAFGWDTL